MTFGKAAAKAMIGRAVQTAVSRSSTATQTTSKRNYSAPGVTSQYDAKLVYRKRRMPRWKKRAWRKFSRKTNAVIEKGLGNRIVLYNNADDVTSAGNFQGFSTWTIYGLNGTDIAANRGNKDVSDVFATASTSASKLIFKSAILDITMTNKGTNNTFGLEVDLYHVVYWNECGKPNFNDVHAASVAETGMLPGKGALSLVNRGCTPFDLPQLLRKTRMRILKKMKYFLGPNEAATYQIRDSRNRRISGANLGSINTEFIQPGMTQGLLIVHKPVAGYQASAGILSVGCTRKYSFTSQEDSYTSSGI